MSGQVVLYVVIILLALLGSWFDIASDIASVLSVVFSLTLIGLTIRNVRRWWL